MDFLFMLHAHFRWIVVLVSLLALGKHLAGWLGKASFKKTDTVLIKIYGGVIDLQVTIGLIYLLWSGFSGAGFPRFRLEHSFIMLIVAVLAHTFKRWNNAEDVIRFRNGCLLLILSLVLIFAGVLLLPNGLQRWMNLS